MQINQLNNKKKINKKTATTQLKYNQLKKTRFGTSKVNGTSAVLIVVNQFYKTRLEN